MTALNLKDLYRHLGFELKDLIAFVAVAESGRFREAADKLGISQARVTQRIRGVEDSQGYLLFENDRRTMTDKGRQFLAFAKELIQTAKEGSENVKNTGSTERRIVRVGLSETMVHTVRPLLVKRVREEYPALILETDVAITPRQSIP